MTTSNRVKILLLCLALTLLTSITQVSAQGQKENSTYKDPDGKYELQLPNNWQAVKYQDGAGNPRVDIVYRDRAYGLLKVTQESITANTDLDNMIHSEIDQNLRFRPGYVFNGTERFVGEHLKGELLQFDFSHAGQPKKGRNYYLKSDGSTVWVLRFAGNRDVFTPLRNETDAIARSFKPLK